MGFTDHAVMALAGFYALTSDKRCREPLERAFRYTACAEGIAEGMDVSPPTICGMTVLSERTDDPRYGDAALRALQKLRTTQDRSSDPYGRDDTWAEWGVNKPEGSKSSGRPPQFLGQARPVTVGFVLSYGQPCLATFAKRNHASTG